MGTFKVHVTKDYLVFCAGHFITYGGGLCETLHGHNYRVAVELEGGLDENRYVFDFVTLKKLMKRLVDELDHRVLLPSDNPLVAIQKDPESVRATYKEKVYVFPSEDVVLLPIENTTAELLAQYLAGRVAKEVAHVTREPLRSIEVEVEESFGQSARYREAL